MLGGDDDFSWSRSRKIDDATSRTKNVASHNLDPTPWLIFLPKSFSDESRHINALISSAAPPTSPADTWRSVADINPTISLPNPNVHTFFQWISYGLARDPEKGSTPLRWRELRNSRLSGLWLLDEGCSCRCTANAFGVTWHSGTSFQVQRSSNLSSFVSLSKYAFPCGDLFLTKMNTLSWRWIRWWALLKDVFGFVSSSSVASYCHK